MSDVSVSPTGHDPDATEYINRTRDALSEAPEKYRAFLNAISEYSSSEKRNEHLEHVVNKVMYFPELFLSLVDSNCD